MNKQKPLQYKSIAQSIILVLSQMAIAEAAELQPNIPRPESPATLPRAVPKTDVLPEQSQQPLKAEKSLKVLVKSVEFSGNEVISNAELESVVAPYINQELDLSGLNEAVAAVRNHYRNKGYLLTQTYLPQQDINNGNVKIAVLEGKLGNISANSVEGLKQERLQGMLNRGIRAGEVISEQNVIRNVILVNALPGLNLTTNISPGAELGTSNVNIDLTTEKRIMGFLSANTFGNPFTGREVIQGGVAVNNIAGVGDQLSINARTSTNGGQKTAGASYTTPINDYATLLNVGYHFVEYHLGKAFKPLGAEGDAHYFNVGLDHALVRDTRKGLNVRLGGQYKDIDDDVRNPPTNNRREITSFDVGLQGDWINALGTTLYQAGINFNAGEVDIRYAAQKLLDSTTTKTDGRFSKWNLSVSRVQYFNPTTIWTLNADYQKANQNLDNVEKFAIGAINRWRAYSELPSQADTGWMLGTELRKNWAVESEVARKWAKTLSPYFFYDLGKGKINEDKVTNNNEVRSQLLGVGVDLAMENNWNLGLVLSEQKRRLEGSSQETEARFWGQLGKRF
jgi:hemolysin activation/secretion protein